MRNINEVYVNGICLEEILEYHKKWLNNEEDGKRADLSYIDLADVNLNYLDLRKVYLTNAFLNGANLEGTNLAGANLRNSDLTGANLKNAILTNSDLFNAYLSSVNLSGANLSNSDLAYTYLKNAFLSNTNLSNVNLTGSYFRNAYLNNVDLTGANLNNADLTRAVLKDIKYDETTKHFTIHCPEEGSFIAYKKADNKIVKLLVTEDAKRSSATTRRCRCSKAKVLSITNIKGTEEYKEATSNYNKNFVYRVGEIVEVEYFDNNRWNECSTGIHFFMTREEAVNYQNTIGK